MQSLKCSKNYASNIGVMFKSTNAVQRTISLSSRQPAFRTISTAFAKPRSVLRPTRLGNYVGSSASTSTRITSATVPLTEPPEPIIQQATTFVQQHLRNGPLPNWTKPPERRSVKELFIENDSSDSEIVTKSSYLPYTPFYSPVMRSKTRVRTARKQPVNATVNNSGAVSSSNTSLAYLSNDTAGGGIGGSGDYFNNATTIARRLMLQQQRQQLQEMQQSYLLQQQLQQRRLDQQRANELEQRQQRENLLLKQKQQMARYVERYQRRQSLQQQHDKQLNAFNVKAVKPKPSRNKEANTCPLTTAHKPKPLHKQKTEQSSSSNHNLPSARSFNITYPESQITSVDVAVSKKFEEVKSSLTQEMLNKVLAIKRFLGNHGFLDLKEDRPHTKKAVQFKEKPRTLITKRPPAKTKECSMKKPNAKSKDNSMQKPKEQPKMERQLRLHNAPAATCERLPLATKRQDLSMNSDRNSNATCPLAAAVQSKSLDNSRRPPMAYPTKPQPQKRRPLIFFPCLTRRKVSDHTSAPLFGGITNLFDLTAKRKQADHVKAGATSIKTARTPKSSISAPAACMSTRAAANVTVRSTLNGKPASTESLPPNPLPKRVPMTEPPEPFIQQTQQRQYQQYNHYYYYQQMYQQQQKQLHKQRQSVDNKIYKRLSQHYQNVATPRPHLNANERMMAATLASNNISFTNSLYPQQQPVSPNGPLLVDRRSVGGGVGSYGGGGGGGDYITNNATATSRLMQQQQQFFQQQRQQLQQLQQRYQQQLEQQKMHLAVLRAYEMKQRNIRDNLLMKQKQQMQRHVQRFQKPNNSNGSISSSSACNRTNRCSGGGGASEKRNSSKPKTKTHNNKSTNQSGWRLKAANTRSVRKTPAQPNAVAGNSTSRSCPASAKQATAPTTARRNTTARAQQASWHSNNNQRLTQKQPMQPTDMPSSSSDYSSLYPSSHHDSPNSQSDSLYGHALEKQPKDAKTIFTQNLHAKVQEVKRNLSKTGFLELGCAECGQDQQPTNTGMARQKSSFQFQTQQGGQYQIPPTSSSSSTSSLRRSSQNLTAATDNQDNISSCDRVFLLKKRKKKVPCESDEKTSVRSAFFGCFTKRSTKQAKQTQPATEPGLAPCTCGEHFAERRSSSQHYFQTPPAVAACATPPAATTSTSRQSMQPTPVPDPLQPLPLCACGENIATMSNTPPPVYCTQTAPPAQYYPVPPVAKPNNTKRARQSQQAPDNSQTSQLCVCDEDVPSSEPCCQPPAVVPCPAQSAARPSNSYARQPVSIYTGPQPQSCGFVYPTTLNAHQPTLPTEVNNPQVSSAPAVPSCLSSSSAENRAKRTKRNIRFAKNCSTYKY